MGYPRSVQVYPEMPPASSNEIFYRPDGRERYLMWVRHYSPQWVRLKRDDGWGLETVIQLKNNYPDMEFRTIQGKSNKVDVWARWQKPSPVNGVGLPGLATSGKAVPTASSDTR